MLGRADVEGVELAEVLLTTETTVLEVTELAVELLLVALLSGETLEALVMETEELIELLFDEDDAEGLTLDEKP